MPALSEKARGKQRAVVIDGDESGQSAPSTTATPTTQREVLIRFSEGAHDLLVPVTATDTVKDLKSFVSSSIIGT